MSYVIFTSKKPLICAISLAKPRFSRVYAVFSRFQPIDFKGNLSSFPEAE